MPIVTYEHRDSVSLLTIARPERRNAMNHEGVAELHEGVRRAQTDGARVLILAGSHQHFCAGADLLELEDLAFTDQLRHALDALADLNVPTVAAIAGSCIGLGAQLALACDIRLATPDARFAVPVAKLGLMVDHWTVQRLALLAGHSMARWMTLTARPVSAEQAAGVGFVQQLVPVPHDDPSAAVLAAARTLARDIANLAPLALSGTKQGLDQLERPASQTDPDGAYRAAFELAWASDDLVEGRQAFRERRPPQFRGS